MSAILVAACGGTSNNANSASSTSITPTSVTSTSVTQSSTTGATPTTAPAGVFPTETAPSASGWRAIEASSLGTAAVVSSNLGRSWRTVALPVPAGSSDVVVGSVSCGTPTFCLAVGETSAAQLVWWTDNAGATWSDTRPDLSLGGLDGVACTSAQFCVAADLQGVLVRTTGPTGFAFATSIPKWSDTVLDAVACVPGSTTCVVMGNADNCSQGGACTPAIGVTGDGQTWTAATLPRRLGALSSISCTATRDCVVGGYQPGPEDSEGNLGVPGATFLLDSHGTLATWTRIRLPNGTYDGLAALSCPTKSFCLAGGVFNHYINSQTPYNSFVLTGPA